MDIRNDREVVEHLISGELDQRILVSATAAATDIADEHGGTVAAILFYGSCLQQGSDEDKVLDFYVLVDSCTKANGSWLLGMLNVMVPPNVFYRELDLGDRTIRSKYAVMSTRGFVKTMRRGRLNPSFWARFAQPCALAYCRDKETRDIVTKAVAQAVITFVGEVVPTFSRHVRSETLWSNGFRRTYQAELRAENSGQRGLHIYQQNQDRFDALMLPALTAAGLPPRLGDNGQLIPAAKRSKRRITKLKWKVRSVQGKVLSFLRLIKGAFTFTGAVDYLAWKIGRHSGVEVHVKPWHRRFQLIGGLSLFVQTWLRGGFR
jgi:hypothetical protein